MTGFGPPRVDRLPVDIGETREEVVVRMTELLQAAGGSPERRRNFLPRYRV